MTDAPEAERLTIRAIYNQCAEGTGPAPLIVVGGATLNALSDTTAYDPARAYAVTPDRITPVE